MKDVFGREWGMVTLKDTKWNDMSNWEKARDCFLGISAIIGIIFFMGWLSKL